MRACGSPPRIPCAANGPVLADTYQSPGSSGSTAYCVIVWGPVANDGMRMCSQSPRRSTAIVSYASVLAGALWMWAPTMAFLARLEAQ